MNTHEQSFFEYLRIYRETRGASGGYMLQRLVHGIMLRLTVDTSNVKIYDAERLVSFLKALQASSCLDILGSKTAKLISYCMQDTAIIDKVALDDFKGESARKAFALSCKHILEMDKICSKRFL